MSTTIQTSVSSRIEKKEVNFSSNGIKIAAHLYLPADIHSYPGLQPAIVVSHPAAGVKEQAAGLYARLLAEKGFIALTFDAAFQGESGGEPRFLEDPAQRIEDIKSAVSFLSVMKEVDRHKIGLLGICASGGYGIAATATDHRIKALATVSAADIGRQFRNGSTGKQSPDVIQAMLDQAAADRDRVAEGKEPGVFPIFPDTADQAKMLGDHGFEGWEYYCTDRAQHPRSARFFQWKSVEHIAGFDAFRFAGLIAPRPLLMIAGSVAETLWMTQEAMETAKGPKELFIIDGASHVALYDKMAFIAPAITKIDDFFRSALQ